MRAIVDTFEHDEWVIQEWKVRFLLSEKQLHFIKKHSTVFNWYEDQLIADTWEEKLKICFNSIHKFYRTFGVLPQVGDRLFDEDTGLLILDRSIDGGLMTVTFTLSN
ncbi:MULTISPECIES: hypothetical protein [Spirosoma]|uniref:Uncharacterized protein n=1 Tax=Spirosoma liriopis TaxID=2937440 RepID=A0ABT0HRE6_9BACT|nr:MULTISPECIES: hypothetical protein [Spirosoma]MCK8494560.1 hypothetical protein [Spirosoma liriopis]UHG89570.1 hypothetical protein LQ777_15090 [Spirosoma oryzicola]